MANYSGQTSPEKKPKYRSCNFSQPVPGTRLWPGDDTPRVFEECNLVNCVPPPGSTLTKCNTTQVERMVEDGTEDVTVGERTVKIKRYMDRILGRLNAKTLKLEIKSLDVQVDPPTGSKDARIRELAKDRARLTVELAVKEADLEREAPEGAI